MRIESFLERSAAQFPDKTALVSGERRLTYREIDDQANRLAHGLIASGIRRWDRIAICLENSPEAVVSIFAALKARGIFLVINPTTKADKIAFILNNCRAKALVTDMPRLAEAGPALPGVPHLETVWLAGAAGDSVSGKRLVPLEACLRGPERPQRPMEQNIGVDPAALIYTSGSTGRPKGVLVTHLNMWTAAESITTYIGNTADDVILNALPLSFDYGLYQVLMAFKSGARIVLHRSFRYPFTIVDQLVREGVTGLPLVPTMASILLQMDLSKYRFPALRYITNTAAALPTHHIEGLRKAFPGAKIFSMYGLTECKRVAYLPPEQITLRPKSVGKAIPNTEAYIVNDAGERVPPGVTGELVVRGSHIMKGYWEMPEETNRILKPGPFPGEKVLHTGDLFTMDEEGYLYFVGRKDDIIKTRGEKVSPKEVEDVLYSLDGVVDAVVVGVPDEVLGEAIKAVVSMRPGARLTAQDVLRHCAQRLEDFMVPKYVEFRESLPSTATGKISRRMIAGGETA
jgi:long-chain acyl-CoA synthetase